jgi:hypothetical protein
VDLIRSPRDPALRAHEAELEQVDANRAMFEPHRLALAKRGRDHQLVVFESSFARPWIYRGEWVADCPREDCNNVEFLTEKPDHLRGVANNPGPRKSAFYCSNCHYCTTSIRWPADADELLKVLDRRPVPDTRNWYPEGHMVAVMSGEPDGQTVEELLQENRDHGVF